MLTTSQQIEENYTEKAKKSHKQKNYEEIITDLEKIKGCNILYIILWKEILKLD